MSLKSLIEAKKRYLKEVQAAGDDGIFIKEMLSRTLSVDKTTFDEYEDGYDVWHSEYIGADGKFYKKRMFYLDGFQVINVEAKNG